MRSILSEREKEKKRKRNILIISLFLLLVLVIGTAGYAFLSSSDYSNADDGNTAQSGVRFTGSKWVVTMDNQDFYFTNSPESVENISVDIFLSLADYNGAALYLVSDNNAVTSEIAAILGRYASRVQEACYGPCEKDLPEKDCTENMIIWQDSSENKVYQEDKCVFIQGDLRAADAFLYHLLGYKSQ